MNYITVILNHNDDTVTIEQTGDKPLELLMPKSSMTEVRMLLTELLNTIAPKEVGIILEEINEDHKTIVEEW